MVQNMAGVAGTKAPALIGGKNYETITPSSTMAAKGGLGIVYQNSAKINL